jgi:hypothetical protein
MDGMETRIEGLDGLFRLRKEIEIDRKLQKNYAQIYGMHPKIKNLSLNSQI